MLHPLIEEFLNYLRYERNFSNYTIRCYGTDLEQYCGYLKSAAADAGQTSPPPEPAATEVVVAASAATEAAGNPAPPPAGETVAPLDPLGMAILAITTADL